MNEAGTSINLFLYREDGSSVQVTMREPWVDPDDRENYNPDIECFKRAKALLTDQEAKGWHLKRQNGGNAAAPATATQPAASNGGGGDTFTATKLSIERDKKDNKIGKLKGGQFLKFGVTLWPEAAAEMGIALNEYAVGDHDIEPISVRYILNNEGKPQKVVGFA